MYFFPKLLDSGSLAKRFHGADLIFPNTTVTVPTIHNVTYSQWLDQYTDVGADQGLVAGIPNFFSSTQFGTTSKLTVSTKFVVVAAMLAVLMRLFTRYRLCMKVWWDDLLAVLAMTFLFVNQTIFAKIDLLGATTISFLPETDLQKEEIRRGKIVSGLQFFLAFELLYLLSLWCVKFSSLVVYLRLVKQTKHITLYLRVAFGICALSFVFCILALFLSCVPVTEFWNIIDPAPQCSRRILLTFGTGISNIITDALVLIVPIPLLLRASLTKLQKFGLVVLYFFGAFVVVASALRFTTQVLNVSIQQTISWSQIEVSLALILACAPMAAKLMLHPIIDHHLVPLLATPDSDTFSTTYEERAKYNKELPDLPYEADPERTQSLPHVAALGKGADDEAAHEYQERPQTNRYLIPPVQNKTVLVREMSSLDYRKLKISKKLVNGQSLWEVRPISGMTSRPTTGYGSRPTTSSGSRPTTSHTAGSRMSLSSYAPSTAAWLAYPGLPGHPAERK